MSSEPPPSSSTHAIDGAVVTRQPLEPSVLPTTAAPTATVAAAKTSAPVSAPTPAAQAASHEHTTTTQNGMADPPSAAPAMKSPDAAATKAKQNLNANAESFTPPSAALNPAVISGSHPPSPANAAAGVMHATPTSAAAMGTMRRQTNLKNEKRMMSSSGRMMQIPQQPLPMPPQHHLHQQPLLQLQHQHQHPPPMPPIYQNMPPQLMMPPMMATMPPPPPSPFFVPQGMAPPPSVVPPFVGAPAPPPPPPPPPFMQTVGAMSFPGPMSMPMAPMMPMTKAGTPMLSALFPNGGMAPPPPLQQPPPQQPQPQPQQHITASMPVPAPQNARVSVGNATLAALVSKEPPKFSCVLLSGIPAVGKTTMGRELVNELRKDGLGWIFFSGADFLAAPTSAKRSSWDTTKEVFDALQKRLNELLDQQRKDRNVKGLVIDKNVKGVEDVYYLSALLKAKQIPFVGIIGMEADNDDILLKRMDGEEILREKIKHHRVIHTRIRGLARATGMYREVDATKSKEEVLNSLRTMVLGCCAQPPQRGIRTDLYGGSTTAIMVDSHTEYCTVLSRVFDLVKSPKGYHYPGTIDYTPFSTREMTDKNRVSTIKSHYGVRRHNDGGRHVLLYYEGRLYLIPTHLKAVLRVCDKAWLGSKLSGIGSFVLEGDLVQLTKDRNKEKILIFEALFWSDSEEPEVNKLMRMNWAERQALLATHLCAEEKAFFPAGADCVVVHQSTSKLENIIDLLDSSDYPSDGLVFQPTIPAHSYDKVYVWRPPSSIVVDFRLGTLLHTEPIPGAEGSVKEGDIIDAANLSTIHSQSFNVQHQVQQMQRSTMSMSMSANSQGGLGALLLNENAPLRTFALEVYDKTEKEYTQFEDCTVEIKHHDVVEGCLCTCVLADEKAHKWNFQRIRYDLLRPAYKRDVSEVLEHCIISKPKLIQWLVHEKFVNVPSTTSPTGTMNITGGTSATSPPLLHTAVPGNTSHPHRPGVPPTYASAVMHMSSSQNSHGGTPLPPPHPSSSSSSVTHGQGGGDGKPFPSPFTPGGQWSGGITSGKSSGLFAPLAPLGDAPRGTTLLSRTANMTLMAGTVNAPTETEDKGPSALQLLTSMVPSVHIVRNDEREEKQKGGSRQSAAPPQGRGHPAHQGAARESGLAGGYQNHNNNTNHTTKRRAPHTSDEFLHEEDKDGNPTRAARQGGHASNNAKATKSTGRVPEQCVQCRKKKQAEDLRLDRRDHRHYCYGCWAKLGWEFCRECGEFKEGYRERTRRRTGEFYCNDCWATFNKSEKEEGGRKKSANELRTQRDSQDTGAVKEGRVGEGEEKKKHPKERTKREKSTTKESRRENTTDDHPQLPAKGNEEENNNNNESNNNKNNNNNSMDGDSDRSGTGTNKKKESTANNSSDNEGIINKRVHAEGNKKGNATEGAVPVESAEVEATRTPKATKKSKTTTSITATHVDPNAQTGEKAESPHEESQETPNPAEVPVK